MAWYERGRDELRGQAPRRERGLARQRARRRGNLEAR